jgi:hypothetical protein
MQPAHNTHQLSPERNSAMQRDLQVFQQVFSEASLAVRRDLFDMQTSSSAGQPISLTGWAQTRLHLEAMRDVLFNLADWVYQQEQVQKAFATPQRGQDGREDAAT